MNTHVNRDTGPFYSFCFHDSGGICLDYKDLQEGKPQPQTPTFSSVSLALILEASSALWSNSNEFQLHEEVKDECEFYRECKKLFKGVGIAFVAKP